MHILMKIIVINLVTLTFLLSSTVTKNVRDSESNASQYSLTDLELPESEVVALDEIILKKLSTAAHYGRKNKQTSNSTSSSVSSGPCSCSLGVCKCCTGLILDLLNQKACMKVTYHPGDFAFDVAMSLNDRILYENSMSGKNPKPICISPPRMPNLKVCAKFYNVFFPGRNIHFCLAMNGQWRSVQLFDMVFDCLRMGANGIAMVKPEDGGGLPVANPQGGVDAVIDSGDDEIEDYDENLVRSIFGLLD